MIRSEKETINKIIALDKKLRKVSEDDWWDEDDVECSYVEDIKRERRVYNTPSCYFYYIENIVKQGKWSRKRQEYELIPCILIRVQATTQKAIESRFNSPGSEREIIELEWYWMQLKAEKGIHIHPVDSDGTISFDSLIN